MPFIALFFAITFSYSKAAVLPTFTYPQVIEICEGESFVFDGWEKKLPADLTQWRWDFGDKKSGAQNSSREKKPSHTFLLPGTYKVRLAAKDNDGETHVWEIDLRVNPKPNPPKVQKQQVCFGDRSELSAIAPLGFQRHWYETLEGNTPIFTGKNYKTPPLPYSSTYYVAVASEKGCLSKKVPAEVMILSEESAQILSSHETAEIPGATIHFRTRSSLKIQKWSWHFGDDDTANIAQPAHKYQYPGDYEISVILQDERGCEVTLRKSISILPPSGAEIPGAFSPNGDGINDVFTANFSYLPNVEVLVFDPEGILILESRSSNFKWDGKDANGNLVAEGVYDYLIKSTSEDGKEFVQRKTITVIR